MTEEAEKVDKKRFKTREERQHEAMEARLDRLAELRGDAIEDVVGYVYRETWGSDKTSLPPIRGVLEDHELGLLYGPGRYIVSYRFVDLSKIRDEDDETELGYLKKSSTTIRYSIGPEYADLHREDCATHGRKCYLDSRASIPGFESPKETGLMSVFKDDNIKGVMAFLTVLKQFFPSHGGSDDLRVMLAENTKIIQAMANGNRNASGMLPEKILELTMTKMLERPEQKSPGALLKEQMDIFDMIESRRNPEASERRREQEEERMKTPFDKLIEKAMDVLPVFLAKFDGDESKAAAAVKRENPMASVMLRSPVAQKAFYRATVEKHGQLAADRWASAFGIDPSTMRPDVSGQPVATPKATSHPDTINLG